MSAVTVSISETLSAALSTAMVLNVTLTLFVVLICALVLITVLTLSLTVALTLSVTVSLTVTVMMSVLIVREQAYAALTFSAKTDNITVVLGGGKALQLLAGEQHTAMLIARHSATLFIFALEAAPAKSVSLAAAELGGININVFSVLVKINVNVKEIFLFLGLNIFFHCAFKRIA